MGIFKFIKKQIAKVTRKPKPVRVSVSKPEPVGKYRDVMGDYITPKNIGKLDPMYKGQYVRYNKTDKGRKIYVLFAKTGAGEVYFQPDDPGMVSTYYFGTGYRNEDLVRYGMTLEEMIDLTCEKQLARGDTVIGFLFFQHD